MSDFTYDENVNLTNNLRYLGLDLNNIPSFLTSYNHLDYSVSRGYDDKTYKLYKYIPINKIQIMITDVYREDELKDRYNRASPIITYINPKEDIDMPKKYEFETIVEELNRDEIEKTVKEQENVKTNIPFRVKFKENYLWQIYYSNSVDQYFMLVPSKDFNSSKMLYLLKEQIKEHNNPNEETKCIYAPISCMDYSEEILSRLEILDLENYLMNFTGNWPQIYEVFDKEDNCRICISGDANVFEGIIKKYRIILENKEKALEFLKLTKALFMMQTEMYNKYKFNVGINENSNLEFWFEDTKIAYENLAEFIGEEYNEVSSKLTKSNEEIKILNQKLQEMKAICFKKEQEYFYKEKEISTYLKYRKTFFGKIKYYFKSKKKNDKKEIESTMSTAKDGFVVDYATNSDVNFYTIDELKFIDKTLAQKEKQVNTIKFDINYLEIKISNLDKKIESAKQYIEEIDKHSKNIFDFWKFTNKDVVELPEAQEEVAKENSNFKLQKVFNFSENFEEFAKNMDVKLRTEFTDDELNTLFLFEECEIIQKDIKAIQDNKTEELEASLSELKEKIKEEETKLGSRNFDVFGNVIENQSVIKVIAGKKHRENKKSIYKLLNIKESTTLEEYITKLKNYIEIIEKCFKKVHINYNLTLYKSYNSYEKFSIEGYSSYSLDVNQVLNQNNSILMKFHSNDYLQAVPYTNIVFYTNFNETLPVGMDCSRKIVLNNENLEFRLVSKREIMLNNYDEKDVDCISVETNVIEIYEYEIKNK